MIFFSTKALFRICSNFDLMRKRSKKPPKFKPETSQGFKPYQRPGETEANRIHRHLTVSAVLAVKTKVDYVAA